MTFVYFIILLGVVIMVHELGHLIVAKKFNVYVREFAIGFGPRLFSKKGKETTYSIRAIPLGGFTAMASETNDFIEGQNDQSDIPADLPAERTMAGAKPYKRALIMAAGPFFNILLAMVVFVAMITINGGINRAPKPIVGAVMENSAAEQAGLLEGDLIVSITYSDGSTIHPKTFSDMVQYNQMYHDTAIYEVKRGDETLTFSVTPTYNETDKTYLIGIHSPAYEFESMNFFQAIPAGIAYCWEVTTLTFGAIVRLLRGVGLDSISGTIGIYKVTEEAVSYGFVSFLSLMGSLSVNLALMNMLPIPLFDGGRIFIIIIEKIIGHKLSEKAESVLMIISLALVGALFIYVTYHDIINLFTN